MLDYKVNKKRFIVLYSIALVILAIVSIVLLNREFNMQYIAIVGFMGGAMFLIYVFVHFKIVHKILNFSLLFSVMLFLFCFGQFFLYGLGVEYQYFFLNDFYSSLYNYDQSYVLYGEVISILAIGMFQFAALLSAKYKKKTALNGTYVTNCSLKPALSILFVITFPIMLIYKLYLMFYSFSNGYAATGALEQPAIVRFVGVFFIPASVGLLVCLKNNEKNFKLLSFVLLMYSGLGLVIGGRTEPLIILASIALLYLHGRKLSLPLLVFGLGFVYLAATLMVSVAELRTSSTEQFSKIFKVFFTNLITFRTVVQLIGEMGFSGSSMIWTVYLVKTGQQEFYYGMTYVGAVVNIIPSSLDFMGVLSSLDKYCHLEGWLTETLGFNFGVGFSLIAEAYLNFGVGAIVVMFFYALLLNHIFNYELKNDAWNLYKSLIMFAVLMTLPRRASLYLVDQWLLCVIAIWAIWQIIGLWTIQPKRESVNGKVAY